MRKLKWIAGALLLTVVPVCVWVGVAHAQRFSTHVDKGQTVYSSLYSTGKNVDINGTVHGDVFCAGQNVTIDAVVHGDVICAGQDVTIAGQVDGDVRVAGQVVTLEATVARSATVASMTFSLDAGAKVGQDLTATGDNLNIKGGIRRDVVASGNAVTLNGAVGRNAKLSSVDVRLKDSARIAGNLSYTSNNEADIARSARVDGRTEHTTPKDQGDGQFNWGFYFFMLFGLVLIGVMLAFFFPKFMRKTSDTVQKSFAKSLLAGLIASFLVPLVAVGLIISLVGIPLTVFVLLAWLFAAALSGPIAAFYVGRLVLRKSKAANNPVLVALAGGAILVTAYFLPLAGPLFVMVAYWVGTGALLLSLKQHVQPGKQA